MPKTTFTRAGFMKANESVKEGGEFGTIKRGIYVATIESCKWKYAESGSLNPSFGWQISDEDTDHPGAYVWWQQNIIKTDGQVNEVGMQMLNQMYHTLSEGQFDPDDYKWDEKTGEVLNAAEVHEKFFGTVAKIQVNHGDEFNGKQQYKIKVKQIITNAYQGDNPVDTPEDEVEALEDNVEEPEVATEEEEEEEKQLYVGAPIIYIKDDKQWRGRVMSFVEGLEGQPGMVRIQPIALADDTFTTKIRKPIMVSEDDVFYVEGVEPYPENPNTSGDPLASATTKPEVKEEVADEVLEEESLEEEPVAAKLEKGMEVSYPYNGKTLKGPIHEINEDEGYIKVVALNGEGKKVARRVDITEVIPF